MRLNIIRLIWSFKKLHRRSKGTNHSFFRNEFGPFYAPDEMHHQHMHGLLVDEYIDDRDADEDYFLSFEEYICEYSLQY